MSKTSQKLLFRYLRLKRRARKSDERSAADIDESLPPLHTLMTSAWSSLNTIGKRHVPALNDRPPVAGTRYVVPLRMQTHEKSGAVIVRMCVYTCGESAGFAPKQMDAPEADISYQQVVDDEGDTLAPGIEFSALMLGRVVLVQNRAGAQALQAVKQVVRDFGKRVQTRGFSMPEFVAIAAKDQLLRIQDAQGIEYVSFGVAKVKPSSGATTSLLALHDYEDKLGGQRTRVAVYAGKDETLDADAGLGLLNDADSEGLEAVKLHLRDGSSISAGEITLDKTVHVGRVNGVPNCDDVDKELLAFLRDLMTVDAGGQQAINADGLIGDKVRMLAVESK
jgi:hypothetical protein